MSDHSALGSQTRGDGDEEWRDALAAMGDDTGTFSEAQLMDLLTHVVEGEIIPRLMLAHQNFVTTDVNAAIESALSAEAIERFAKLTIAGEVEDLEYHIVSLTRQGMIVETVYLELLAPAARKLGEFWEQDLCSFTDVTIGLGRLQTLLYRLSARQVERDDPQASFPKGLFVTPSGGHHSFGIRMVEGLFRRAGWRTLCEPNIDMHEFVALLQSEAFDLVGIGVTIQGQIEIVGEMIRQARLSSQNRDIKIMIGGNLVVDQPELFTTVGADLSAKDAREAVTIAQNIIYDRDMRH